MKGVEGVLISSSPVCGPPLKVHKMLHFHPYRGKKTAKKAKKKQVRLKMLRIV